MSTGSWGRGSVLIVPHIPWTDHCLSQSHAGQDNGRVSPPAGSGGQHQALQPGCQQEWMKARAALRQTPNVPSFPCSPLREQDYH